MTTPTSFEELIVFLIAQTTAYFTQPIAAVQWVLLAIAALAVAIMPRRFERPLRGIRKMFVAIAVRKRLAIAICGILPVAVRLSLLGVIPVPYPSIHDENSHLLLADTFAHGRWTNPTPALWRHFESIHIIQRPTYASMYPPGQGAFLAAGQVLFGHPWAGVLIGTGLMFGVMCWMMQGWVPPAWALFGTLIAILQFGLSTLWINSYMSGAVAGIGGGLLAGAFPRIREGARWSNVFAAGLGVVVLMNTRPFEGAVLSIAVAIYLARGLWGGFASRPKQLAMVLWPAAAMVACGFAFTGLYSWKVTGNPLRMPYQVNRATYGWPENLVFLRQKKIVFEHRVLADMYKMETDRRSVYATPTGFLASINLRFFTNWSFFLGPLLTAPLLFLPWVIRERRTRPLTVLIGITAAMNLAQLVLYPFHLGPVVPILFAIVAAGCRHMYVTLARSRRTRALAFAVVLPVALVPLGAIRLDADSLGIALPYWEKGYEGQRDARQDIEQWLEARPRKQLVIVRYSPGHSPNQEWVYNGADIEGSKVVWARDMGSNANAELLAHFADREVWMLKPDVTAPHVIRYARADRTQSPESGSNLPCEEEITSTK